MIFYLYFISSIPIFNKINQKMEENQNTSNSDSQSQNSHAAHVSNNPNPAAIDINIINISSNHNHSTNEFIDKDFKQPIENTNNQNANFCQINKNEKIRKASCDISLFETETNKEKENHHLNSNEDSTFNRNTFDNSRDNRIIIPENDEFSRAPSERVKKTFTTKKYKYIGETLNDKRDGFGVCEFSNGKVYTGMFRNDMRDGYGKIIHTNGDVEYAEFSDDKMNGYYECIKKDGVRIESLIRAKSFSEFIVFEKNNIKYQGEPQPDDNSNISFGKLTIKKEDSKKIFVGNVLNYQTENGIGLFYKENTLFYGEIKNKTMVNYIENYSNDAGCFLGFLRESKKNGIGISFLKDGRVCIGEFEDDQKKGPIFIFTIPKPNVKMELYLMGFKTKTVEKIDTIKKYLLLNYPEYCRILKVDFEKLINKLSRDVNEEIANSSRMIESFKNE